MRWSPAQLSDCCQTRRQEVVKTGEPGIKLKMGAVWLGLNEMDGFSTLFAENERVDI